MGFASALRAFALPILHQSLVATSGASFLPPLGAFAAAERKRIMFERSDAFVALPGGIGTLEELVEQMTWAQLGQHVKPILLANIDGFWEPLLTLLTHMRTTAFIRPTLPLEVLTADRTEGRRKRRSSP